MIVAYIKIAPWDSQPIRACKKRGKKPLKMGDFEPGTKVIVRTSLGIDLGTISKVEEVQGEETDGFILRKANKRDIKEWKEKNNSDFKKKAKKKSQEVAEKHDLPMKIIDALLSFDGGRITFAFTAP